MVAKKKKIVNKHAICCGQRRRGLLPYRCPYNPVDGILSLSSYQGGSIDFGVRQNKEDKGMNDMLSLMGP